MQAELNDDLETAPEKLNELAGVLEMLCLVLGEIMLAAVFEAV